MQVWDNLCANDAQVERLETQLRREKLACQSSATVRRKKKDQKNEPHKSKKGPAEVQSSYVRVLWHQKRASENCAKSDLWLRVPPQLQTLYFCHFINAQMQRNM